LLDGQVPGVLVGVTLGVAVGVLRIPVSLPAGRLAYALTAFAAGVAGLLAMGLVFVGLLYVISGEAWRLPEAVGQALYLLCGAVFPITVLPPGWRPSPGPSP